jgi:glyoxylase I family protein
MSILPRIEHIALTVKNLQESRKFYTELMVKHLGGKITFDEKDFFAVSFDNGFLFELFSEDEIYKNSTFSRYQVGLHHFGLQLENKQAVDTAYEKLLELGANILDKPAFYPEYAEGYYAVYYEDVNGFKMEFLAYDKT